MKILVTGTKGQVSRCLQERVADVAGIDLLALGRPELDLLKPDTIVETIDSYEPDIVVSAAAYTAVDQAEDEPDIAFAANETGAGAVAAAARAVGAPVIHLSTDYVFSGTSDRPYVEDDTPDPINVYGASKLAGERAVAASNERHVILRTAWVYSPFGENFYTTLLKLAETQDEISVVCDQWGNPTSAFDLADAILHVSRRLIASKYAPHYGIFHLTGGEAVNWSGFAERIMELSRRRCGPYAKIRKIGSTDGGTSAKRPENSRLQSSKFASVYSWSARPLDVSINEIKNKLGCS